MIKLFVNGKEYVTDVDPAWSLAYVLRNNLGLTGTKIACSVGACGSCTVVVDGQAINSCLTLAMQAEGKSITTIEGLAQSGKLHPLQQSFIDHHGLACGYCTPGVIMAAKALLDRNSDPSEEEVKEAIGGHICRCGTYRRIAESILSAAKLMRKEKHG
jgi:aerobic-type carbon monoxide dehydrogenase small subunit (CoxS/CutS family)